MQAPGGKAGCENRFNGLGVKLGQKDLVSDILKNRLLAKRQFSNDRSCNRRSGDRNHLGHESSAFHAFMCELIVEIDGLPANTNVHEEPSGPNECA